MQIREADSQRYVYTLEPIYKLDKSYRSHCGVLHHGYQCHWESRLTYTSSAQVARIFLSSRYFRLWNLGYLRILSPRVQQSVFDAPDAVHIDHLCEPGACEFHLQSGPSACGTSVMANEFVVNLTVRSLNPTTVGMDMESYSVFLAASKALEPRPKALVVKSICDYANAEKDDQYQMFAAFTASRFVEHLLTQELDFCD